MAPAGLSRFFRENSAAAVHILQLRKANYVRRLCGVLASIPGAAPLSVKSIHIGSPHCERQKIDGRKRKVEGRRQKV